GVPMVVMRTHILNIMRNVVENSRRGEHNGHFTQRVPIPLEIISPTLPLLNEGEKVLRLAYIHFMMALMDDGTALVQKIQANPHARKVGRIIETYNLYSPKYSLHNM